MTAPFAIADNAHAPSAHGKLISRALRAYFNSPDHPAKLRLWSLLRRLTGDRRLTIAYADAGFITVNEHDWLQRLILATGAYEPEVWSALNAFAGRDEIFWDIGAHIGAMSIRALLNPAFAEVHAFEADPAQAGVLRHNLALNRGHWIVRNVALSDECSEKSFYRATGTNSGMSTLVPTGNSEVIKVECTTIDELIFRDGVTPPTLMKIDVEGWESHVFQGARRMLAEMPPKAIVFETATDAAGQPASEEITRALARYDLRLIARPSGERFENDNYCATPRRSVHAS